MSRTLLHLRRGLLAEVVRTGGRGPLWTLLAPAAVVLPLAISLVIAYVAERFARIPNQVSVQQVSTSNSAYWVVNTTVVIMALAAAYGQSRGSSRNHTGQFVRLALPRPWTDLVAKWLFYGALAAVVTAGTLVVLLVALPLVSPLVYGGVAVGDGAARHLLWSAPVLAYFAAGAGIGVGALISTPTVGIGAILFWVYVVETAVGYLPGGFSFQRFMPFLNGVYGTGQDIVLTPPWSPLGALAYGCLAFGVVFAFGVWSVTASRGLRALGTTTAIRAR